MKKCIVALLFLCSCNFSTKTSIEKTQEETDFIDAFFNGSINQKYVNFFEKDTKSDHLLLGYTHRNNVYFTTFTNYTEDRAKWRPLLVHEMTHVWQWQHTPLKLEENDGVYTFKLLPEKHFSEYGIEQQADIIELFYALDQNPDAELGSCLDCGLMSKSEIYDAFERLYDEMLSSK